MQPLQPMEDIYKDHARTVYRYLLSLTHEAPLAEELTQETFYQAIRSADRFDGSCKVSTWLCAVAKNQWRAYQRKHAPTMELSEETLAVASAESAALSDLSRLELLRKLHELAEPWREVLYLRIFGQLSFREIGDILEQTENWARVTYYRGKEKLKKEMDIDE